MSTPFATLARPASIAGIGLHSGAAVNVRLLPREQRQGNAGIVFMRTDLPGAPEVPAFWRCIGSTHHATTLQQGDAFIGTPEHLLAALWGLGITDCRIELDAPEIPILDGSARLWWKLIQSAGRRELKVARPEYSLREPVAVYARDGAVIGLPHPSLRVTVDVDYGIEYLPVQVFAADVTQQSFESEIAPARTFTLESWIEPLRASNMIRGGSTENALVLWEKEPSSAPRFGTELARHKALDLLGDVALLFGENGGTLNAHLIAIRAGHELHRLWMEEAAVRGLLSN
jgi:UDP-3-O-[3-hydroxymyristoyl] N-acetylglucosamine deacetylase